VIQKERNARLVQFQTVKEEEIFKEILGAEGYGKLPAPKI
jgi:hypothetical protein